MKKLLLLLTLLAPLNALAADVLYYWDSAVDRDNGVALGLSEIAGVDLYIGTKPGVYQPPIKIRQPALLTGNEFTVKNVAPGGYYACMKTVDIDGRQSSSCSPEFVYSVPLPPSNPTVPANITVTVTISITSVPVGDASGVPQ